jgi:hypothetical protein
MAAGRGPQRGLGSGSEFIVELPTFPASAQPADVSEPVPPLPPCRILLVDDNPDAVETIATLLETLGASVATRKQRSRGPRDDRPGDA